MKAIRVSAFGDASEMVLEEIASPTPGVGEVLVRVRAVGVNPVETYIRAGAYALLPDLPFTPGGDAAGVVEGLGTGVNGLSVGQRVYVAAPVSAGSYAELMVADTASVHPLPDHVSFAQGAAVGVPYATAYRALHQKAQALPGESVFIHGASGAVGVASLQLARAHGMRVIGSAGTDRGRALVAEHGADLVLDHTSSGYLDALLEFTNGEGPNVILEMLANVNLNQDLGVVARFGRVIVIGNRGPTEIDARLTMGKDSTIRGMALWNASEDERASIHAALGAGLANGSLQPVVGKELRLADAAKAHVEVLEPGAYGKIVLLT
ncbi:MAG: NADPH2:quinone reductase [Gammaproteobacteria bacterium]|jgi:NADPH2:quinone reductase